MRGMKGFWKMYGFYGRCLIVSVSAIELTAYRTWKSLLRMYLEGENEHALDEHDHT